MVSVSQVEAGEFDSIPSAFLCFLCVEPMVGIFSFITPCE